MGKRHPHWIICITGLLFLHSFGYGQFQFDKSEYAARRQNLMEFIPDGIVIIRGAELPGSYMEYYQNNDFMYFSGVEIPNAILIIDGKRKESTLFFTISESSARNEGIPFDLVRNPREVTGIEHVRPFESFSSVLNSLSSQVSVFYTPFKPEELMRECTKEKFRARQRDMTLNEWDGRLTRELQFVKLLQERFPMVLIKDYFKKMQGGFGHYVGMAVHDVGPRLTVLKPGMVIANEPLAVWAEEELGVRVEDTILITEDGCENLTAGIPRTVKDIEALMKKDGVVQVLKKKKLY